MTTSHTEAVLKSARGSERTVCRVESTRVEKHPLAGSTVTVSNRAFLRLYRSRMTIFAQELAVLVFTKEGLAQSTLTEKSDRWQGAPKHSLIWTKCRLLQVCQQGGVVFPGGVVGAAAGNRLAGTISVEGLLPLIAGSSVGRRENYDWRLHRRL
ncbi:uncharacterized protein AB9W97_014270 isoform 1-T2 [Spinachia spinachia]